MYFSKIRACEHYGLYFVFGIFHEFWHPPYVTRIYGISAQKERFWTWLVVHIWVIFGAIKNRRIYVFHEEPLMDEDYTAAPLLAV